MLRLVTSALIFAWLLAPASAAEYIKIASWNIENLGDEDSRQSDAALAQHIELLSLDVIALQEIHDNDGTSSTRKNKQLDETLVRLSLRPGHDWDYRLFEKRNPSSTSQLTGIAWNKERLSLVGNPFRVRVVDDPTDDFSTWDRHPHAVKLSAGSGKTDLVIVSVHMKANHGTCKQRRNCVEHRAAEARLLVDQLLAVTSHFGNEADVVIIGDTNMLGTWEEGHQTIDAAGFEDLNKEDTPTYSGSKAPFDRIFVPRGQREFRWSRQYILTAGRPGNHESALSDHHMIAAMVRILDDDD